MIKLNSFDAHYEVYKATPTRVGIQDDALISMVVTSYTSERLRDLRELLHSMSNQSISMQTVLVIERSSKLRDSLLAFLSSSDLEWILVFSASRLGISNARNLGISLSSCPLVGFVDDDAILPPDWGINVLHAVAEHKDVCGITGQAIPKWMDEADSWFPESLHWMIGCTSWRSSYKPELVTSLSGVNMVFRRHVFDKVKFVDQFTDGAQARGKLGLPNEDNDFATRLMRATGKRIFFSPDIRVYHKVYPFKLTNSYVRRYAFWQGMAESKYDANQVGQFRGPNRILVVRGIFQDVLAPSPNRWKVIDAILTFLIFGVLGLVSYRSKAISRLVQGVL